jgi:hypothetical protein
MSNKADKYVQWIQAEVISLRAEVEALKQVKPDCRVCENNNKRPCRECINGDEFKERQRIQLWRTE